MDIAGGQRLLDHQALATVCVPYSMLEYFQPCTHFGKGYNAHSKNLILSGETYVRI